MTSKNKQWTEGKHTAVNTLIDLSWSNSGSGKWQVARQGGIIIIIVASSGIRSQFVNGGEEGMREIA
jgi:hypothetical protein